MKIGLALALGLAVAAPAAAQAEGGRFLPQLLSPGWSSIDPTEVQPAYDGWSDLVIRGEGMTIAASDAEMGFGALENGETGLYLRAPKLVIRGDLPGSPVLGLEGVDMMIDPRHVGGCGLLDAVREVRAKRGEIRFPEGTGYAADLLEVNTVAIRMEPVAACTAQVSARIASALIGQAEVGSITASEVSLTGKLPMSVDAAQAMGSTAMIDLGVEKISTWHSDGNLVHTTSELSVSMEADPKSVVPLFLVLEQRDFFAPGWNGATAFMDGWNIANYLRADVEIDTLTTQLIPTGIVPPSMTLPFASAGLSTTSSTFEGRARLRRGAWGLWMQSYTAGLGAFQADLGLLPAFYTRDALTAADRAGPAGRATPPTVKLESFDLTWTDTGLDEAVATLFGLPAALLVREALTEAAASGADRTSALARLIWFFDRAANGKPMQVKLADESGVDLLNVVEVLSADPLWIASRLGFTEKPLPERGAIPSQ